MDIDPRCLQRKIACAMKDQRCSTALERQFAVIIRQTAVASKLAREIGHMKVGK